MKLRYSACLLTAMLSITGHSQASSTILSSTDVLTNSEAVGRYAWLETCYSGLLIELAEQILDPSVPRTGQQKIDELEQTLLYDNGVLKDRVPYFTFNDNNGDNPLGWTAGKSASDTCTTIPSGYAIGAMLFTLDMPQYCGSVSLDDQYEHIKSIQVSNLNNESDATTYS